MAACRGVSARDTHTYSPWGGGLFYFILLAVKETVLNIWKPDLTKKLRPAARAAWWGQQLCPELALAEDSGWTPQTRAWGGEAGGGGEKQGRGGSTVWRLTTQGVQPTRSISTTWELTGNAEPQALRWTF